MTSKPAPLEATFFDAFAGTAGAKVVPTELLREFLVAVDDSHALSDLRFGGETPSPFAHRLEKNGWLWELLDRMGHLLGVNGRLKRQWGGKMVRQSRQTLTAWTFAPNQAR